MFYLSGVVITIFLLLLLVAKKGKSSADFILACWLALIGFHLFLFYLFTTGKIFSYPHLLAIQFPFPLMHGPFLYLYAKALTGNLNVSNKKYLLHFIPALVSYLYLMPFFLLSAEQKIAVVKQGGTDYKKFISVLVAALIVSGIVYVILTMLLHRKHKRNILNLFSNTEKINLDWIQYLMFGIGIIWLFVIFTNDQYIFAAVVFFILFIGFFGIRQTPIFTVNNPAGNQPTKNFVEQSPRFNKVESINTEPASQPSTSNSENMNIQPAAAPEKTEDEKVKYQKSGLDEAELLRIYEQLTQLMGQDKLYTNPELTLGETAQQLNVHPNYLSQVINSVAKKNFYDYINEQRVEEFYRLAQNGKNQKFTLLSIAFECGFNSKTSFNRNFRKVTGLSPTEYLKQLNVKVEDIN